MCESWYALHTKPFKEEVVVSRLCAQAVTVYYPTVAHRRYVERVVPFFPGYLFVQTDLSRVPLGTFNWLPGSRGLVQFGEAWPVVVDEAVIVGVKRSVAAFVARREGKMVRGTAVEITGGPFAGYEGVFERYRSGQKRVEVLIALLGRRVTVGSGDVLTAV